MHKVHNILTPEGYWARFNELHAELRSQRSAWREVEAELYETYGVSKYSTFESLKSARSRIHRRKRKSKDIFK